MMNLKSYIAEKVNDTNRLKHLSHLEDLIFEEGAVGLGDAIESLSIYHSMIHNRTNARGSAVFTEKWDGSPSIIIHQTAKDYWVASKSAFNESPKLNRTEADIKTNHGHSPGLMEKLTYALKYCKNLNINGTVQGDFLYTDGDLVYKTIDGVRYVTFTPNTITYAVPVESDLGTKIITSKLGIIFHTSYTGTDPKTMKASIGTYNASRLRKSREIYFDDAIFRDGTNALNLTLAEDQEIKEIIKRLTAIKLMIPAPFLNQLANHDKLSKLMANYNNANVRAGDYTRSSAVNGFVPFIEKKYEKEIEKVKMEKTKQQRRDLRDEMIKFITDNHGHLTYAYEAFALMVKAKMMIVNKLNTLTRMRTFVQKGNELKPTTPEGFVAVHDNRVVKLVDRLEFSRNNFLGRE